MAVNLSPIGGVAAQFFDNSGNILSGGKIYTYTAGTTTPQTTYTSAGGATAHANPIILDAAGRVPSGEIWLTDGLQYKFLIKTSADVQIGSYDNIIGINSNFVNYTNSQEFQTATAGQTVFTLTTMVYQPGTNSLSVFVDGVNQYGPGALYAFQETSDTVVTFTAGLHVGAEVKFTTSAINASSYGDAAQISYIPPFTGGVATNVELKLAQTISVMDFGAVGNGIANDTTAVQAAIDAAAAIGGTVYIPRGKYRVTSPLNITNLASGGLTICGDGWGINGLGSTILADTGGVALDCTGSQHVAIRNLNIDAVNGTLSTPSTLGILFARSTTSQYAQFNTLDNVLVNIPSIPAAYGGKGSVAVYNKAAEIHSYNNVYLLADTPLVIAAFNPWNVASPYQTIETSIVSTSQINVNGASTLTAWGSNTYAAHVTNASGIEFNNLYCNGLNKAHFYLDGCHNLTISGQLEGGFLERAVDFTSVDNANFMFAGMPNAVYAPFNIPGAFGGVTNISINLHRTEVNWPELISGASISVIKQLTVNISGDDGTLPLTTVFNVSAIKRTVTTGLTTGGFTNLHLPGLPIVENQVLFTAIDPATANNQCLFLDSTTNKLSFKNGGVVYALY